MKRSDYQKAFSGLEPSQASVDRVLEQASAGSPGGVRLGTLLVAAVLAVLVLSGGVLAANRTGWLSQRPVTDYRQPELDQEAAGKADDLPAAPESRLDFDAAKGETYVGFLLPEEYWQERDPLNCLMLARQMQAAGVAGQTALDSDTLTRTFARYYRGDSRNPENGLLTIEIKDSGLSDYRAYYVQCEPRVVKEEPLNGIDTVWLEIPETLGGIPCYSLFQYNEALGCIAMINSSVSFADAEQAARSMTYVDSGMPVNHTTVNQYGLRVGTVPAGMHLGYPPNMAEELRNYRLADPNQNLENVYGSLILYRDDSGIEDYGATVYVLRNSTRFSGGNGRAIFRSASIGEHEAVWRREANGEVLIQVWYPEQSVQLNVWVGAAEEAEYPGDVESFLENLELVEIPVIEESPAVFAPFSVG